MTGDRGSDPSADDALTDARETALACIDAGIEAADPARVIADAFSLDGTTLSVSPAADSTRDSIDLASFDRVLVLGAGNAAGRAARALGDVLGDFLDGGLVVTDAPEPGDRIEMRTADHPVPTGRGVAATRALLECARDADADTLVFVLVTGGGSALLPAPTRGVPLAALQAVTESLLRSGAPIEDVNAVRKHLSDVKGGRLAATLAPARVVTFAISDVVGNSLDVVASGPTVPDPTTYQDALDALDRHDVDTPEAVRECLRAGNRGARPETPEPGDPAFDRSSVHVLADSYTACAAARVEAESRGYDASVLTTRVTGPAREAARWHAAIGQELAATGNPLEPPAVVITGGETTVRVTGEGRGGPNHEFALAAAPDLPDGAVLVAVDTDGIDGNTDAAGAIVGAGTAVDDEAVAAALNANDSHGFLAERGALVETGVTGTNVNDLRVLAVVAVPDR
jgi:hydroxypyruvate reductase